jgi:large subunit ribosomal protein L29
MKPEELRVLDVEELLTRLKSSRRELYELRFKLAVGQLDDHRQIRKVRQDIAQILTFKRQRELGVIQETEEPAQVEPVVAAAPAKVAPAKTEAKAADGETEVEE